MNNVDFFCPPPIFWQDQFTSDSTGTLLDLLLTSNLTRALNAEGERPLVDADALREDLKLYFAGNFSSTWEKTLRNVDSFMEKVSLYLSCFDFNKFAPMPTERALEVEGIRLIKENKLWAGLVFVGFPTDEDSEGYEKGRLPEFIRYKIRLDSDKVDTTRYVEDRLTRPGPRRRPGIDLKYLYFGFAYLQVGSTAISFSFSRLGYSGLCKNTYGRSNFLKFNYFL